MQLLRVTPLVHFLQRRNPTWSWAGVVQLSWFPRERMQTLPLERLRGSLGAATSPSLLSTQGVETKQQLCRAPHCLCPGAAEMHESRLCILQGRQTSKRAVTIPYDGCMYQLPGAAVTHDHKLGCLKTTELYSCTVLEARSPKPRCQPSCSL